MKNENEIKKREIKDYIISLVESNHLEEAKEFIDEYRTKVPDDAEIYSIMAVIYINENKINEAEQILREGLKIQNDNLDLMYNLAYLYEFSELKCLPLALNYYKRAFCYSKDEEFRANLLIIINKIKNQLITVEENNKPRVSIVILAYNQLEYTKKCIESIYQYTSHINFELITVNNGSFDDTKKYFDSLQNTKKINIVNNVRPVDGFNAGIELAEGKYTACICNDFIFTENWLDNLLKCIESDESIGFVSPGANKVSNYQQIECNYNSIEEMQKFAKGYNISDPKKWEERVKLLPCVLLCKTELLKDIVGFDPRFYFGEFADDDISIRIRRAGYKLIYSRDTFVHHGGSVTTREDHIKNNSMEISKKIFINKFNIDSWIEASFSPEIVDVVNLKNKDNIDILGINTFCGGTPLQVKNRLKTIDVTSVKITNITENKKYVEDLKTVSNEVYYSNIIDVENCIGNSKFDFIIYESGLDNVNNIREIIDKLKKHLNKDGQFIFTINNEAYFKNLFYADKYEQTLYSDDFKVSYLNLNKTIEILSSNDFYNIKIDRIILPFNERLVTNLVNVVPIDNQEEFKKNIVTFKFIISCELK